MSKRLLPVTVLGFVCFLAVALSIWGAGQAEARPFPQPQASMIAGEVRDSNGDLAVDVEVTCESVFGGFTRTTYTDENGIFVFDNLQIGRYTVSVCDGVGEGSSITVTLAGPDYFVFLTAPCEP